MLILDTHVLVWIDQGSERLGQRARRQIETAYKEEELSVSAVSFLEIVMLIRNARLRFDGLVSEWRVTLLNSGFREIPADGKVSLAAAQLSEFDGDSVDRLIVATAIEHEARIMTADTRILSYRSVPTVSALS